MKLSDTAIKDLKNDLFNTHPKPKIKDLAKKYGISKMHIARIAKGESRANVLPKLFREKKKSNPVPMDIIKNIEAEFKNNPPGLRQVQIAKKYNVSEVTVSRIKAKFKAIQLELEKENKIKIKSNKNSRKLREK